MSRADEARAIVNDHMLENWLVYYGGAQVRQRGKKSGVRNPNRATSAQVEANLRWLEAMRDPAAARTNAVLRFYVLHKMPAEKPKLYGIFEHVYLMGYDYAAPERWKWSDDPEDRANFGRWEAAKRWVLEEVGDETLFVPDPEKAQGFVEESRKRQNGARAVYANSYRAGLEAGHSEAVADGKAREKAAKASAYSPAQLRRIIPPLRRRKKRG